MSLVLLPLVAFAPDEGGDARPFVEGDIEGPGPAQNDERIGVGNAELVAEQIVTPVAEQGRAR